VSGAVAEAATSRDRLLDAAERCLRRSGIRRTTVTEIAEEAGTSRAWLYRNFPDKSAIVLAAIARTDEQFWADARARVQEADGLAAQVVAAVRFSLDHQAGALALHLQETEPDAFGTVVGTGLRALMPGMALFWHEFLVAARDAGEVRADLDIAGAAEWVLRIVVSLVTMPLARPDDLDRFVADHLVAGLA
jgi:AcrR family transcriptional regulator